MLLPLTLTVGHHSFPWPQWSGTIPFHDTNSGTLFFQLTPTMRHDSSSYWPQMLLLLTIKPETLSADTRAFFAHAVHSLDTHIRCLWNTSQRLKLAIELFFFNEGFKPPSTEFHNRCHVGHRLQLLNVAYSIQINVEQCENACLQREYVLTFVRLRWAI